MKIVGLSILLAAASGAAFAQQWEFGGLGGGGFLSNVSVSSPVGGAHAGFQPGGAFGAFFGQNISPHFTGEIRYEYLQNNLQLTSGGQTARFSGAAHAVHYDMLWHTNRKDSKIQFFAALGGGMKIFQGTGTEAAYQPLSQYGYFTKTRAVKPMLSVGGGFTYALTQHTYLRTEFRDFVSPFPTQIITPAPNAKYGTLLHDFVPMVGIEYVH
jgi:hypothetical protein